jgi:hypothetical protein
MLSGISPAQDLVICLEPDGSVVLEGAEAGACTPCGGTEEASREVERQSGECCPCVDIPLPTQDECLQAKRKASDARGSHAAVFPPSCLATAACVQPAERALRAGGQPRLAQRIALIWTVILRV